VTSIAAALTQLAASAAPVRVVQIDDSKVDLLGLREVAAFDLGELS
jgi:hypothetical protein